MADPTAALRATVHTHLLPALATARRHLDAGELPAAADGLDRAEDIARGLLHPPTDDATRDLHRLLADAADRARRDHAGRLAVHLGTTTGSGDVGPDVATVVDALVDEAAANTARHRGDGLLELHAEAGTDRLSVVARSTGTLHHGDHRGGDADHDSAAIGTEEVRRTTRGGMGLHLLRDLVTGVGGDLQVLHDHAATTLVATLPRTAPHPTPHGR